MNVVVVESPAKAKTINKYLGKDYEVLASFGHVRDLPPKNGSVDPDKNFHMLWEVDDKAKKRLNDIAKAVKNCSRWRGIRTASFGPTGALLHGSAGWWRGLGGVGGAPLS